MIQNNKETTKFYAHIKKSCTGCRDCTDAFACPAILFNEEKKHAYIDPTTCIGCGQCIPVCKEGQIERKMIEEKHEH